jgi:hypothetical protein
VTLHVVESVDTAVTYVELSRGAVLPPALKATGAALVSRGLSADPPVDRGLNLGSSASSITSALGPPTTDTTAGKRRTLTYLVSYQQGDVGGVYYRATFALERDRTVHITVWSGGD